MPRITPDHELAASKDLIGENIDKLRQLFPNIVSEDKIDFSALRQLLGDEVTEDEEYFRFVWPGKRQARAEALKPSTGTLRPAPEESLDWDTTQNLYLEGDNLEVLKLLQRSYAGKVKMIYIDPPYNTGKDFVYKDNYRDNLKNYRDNYGRKDEEGNIVSNQAERNSESDGRYHSNWLNMMYPRLQLARNLLQGNGVIFISIDDAEVENLRKISNEIFGEENLLTSFVWRRRKTQANLAKHIAPVHDYILAYTKDLAEFQSYRIPYSEDFILANFTNPDNDTRGVYQTGPLARPANSSNKEYELVLPNGRAVTAKWSCSQETFDRLVAEDRLYIPRDGEGMPRKKIFLNELPGMLPNTWLDDVASNDEAANEIAELFGSNAYFSYPKPANLMSYFLEFGSSQDDLVLDFFSGSATMAHAVVNLSKHKDGGRRYILVQLPERIDIKSEAHKAGYHTIAEIGKERIRRVAQKIWEEDPEKADKLDLGFRVFKLDSSNIEVWDPDPAKLEDNLFANNIKEDRSAYDLVFEILLKYGLDLSLPIAEREGDGHTFYSVGSGALLLCLGRGITRRSAQTLLDWSRELGAVNPKVVFRDTGFTSSVEKTNAYELLRSGGVEDVKSV